jgi:hypothetical protein
MTRLDLTPRELALVHEWLRLHRGIEWTWCPLDAVAVPLGDPLIDELLWTIAGSAAARAVPHAASFKRRIDDALGDARIAEFGDRMACLVGRRIVELAEMGGLQDVVDDDLSNRDARSAAAERGGFAIPGSRRVGRPS